MLDQNVEPAFNLTIAREDRLDDALVKNPVPLKEIYITKNARIHSVYLALDMKPTCPHRCRKIIKINKIEDWSSSALSEKFCASQVRMIVESTFQTAVDEQHPAADVRHSLRERHGRHTEGMQGVGRSTIPMDSKYLRNRRSASAIRRQWLNEFGGKLSPRSERLAWSTSWRSFR